MESESRGLRIFRSSRAKQGSERTYSAFYQDDHSRIIYRRRKDDGTLLDLPGNAKPKDDPRSTFNRDDGGDRLEFALFETTEGEVIVVQCDQYIPYSN